MSRMNLQTVAVLGILAALAGCSREPEPPSGLLQQVPAETPYVFVTDRHLPDGLRARLGDHYAAQLAQQRGNLLRVRLQAADSEELAPMATQAARFLDVLDALLAEFEGRGTADQLRELGIEPVTRSVFYGLGLLPAMRVEIADPQRLQAMLDRVEQRAGVRAERGTAAGQEYRRVDLGQLDLVIAIDERHLIAGLLADDLFDRYLPLLLGQQAPVANLADAGDIGELVERHGLSGYGEGFVRLDLLFDILRGNGEGYNAEVMRALTATPLPVPAACLPLTQGLVAGMPRLVMGISQADDRHLGTRAVWESSPAVAGYLQKLATPVAGLGADFDGLLAVGMGLDLPQLRNAIDALLRHIVSAGADCKWVDPAKLDSIRPQLSIALGPMTAGIKGFLLQLDSLRLDPVTHQPTDLGGVLLAAVDDPRGVFALAGMLDPALAGVQIPDDGSFIELPQSTLSKQPLPPIRVAIRDQGLLLLAGADAARLAQPLGSDVVLDPPPLFAVDYGVRQLIERFGGLLEGAAQQLLESGEQQTAQDLLAQLEDFRLQARLFERLQLSVSATGQGLVMDQVVRLR